jgi:deoxyribose-phosphate aldolase
VTASTPGQVAHTRPDYDDWTVHTQGSADQARRVLALLDLTDLADDCPEHDITELCHRALDVRGHVAAVCVWPQFVAQAAQLTALSHVRVATVVNFPNGRDQLNEVVALTTTALHDGADDIDMVIDWRRVLEGDTSGATTMVSTLKKLLGPDNVLKVILETGHYPDTESIRSVGQLAIDAGADFLKTSTGKTAMSATPEAVETLLHVIHGASRPVGIKPSGGIRTLAQATRYLALADKIMGPHWASPETFRFGASALHDEVMTTIDRA